jgi:hypothetical protein
MSILISISRYMSYHSLRCVFTEVWTSNLYPQYWIPVLRFFFGSHTGLWPGPICFLFSALLLYNMRCATSHLSTAPLVRSGEITASKCFKCVGSGFSSFVQQPLLWSPECIPFGVRVCNSLHDLIGPLDVSPHTIMSLSVTWLRLDYRMRLNNYLQVNGGTERLSWTFLEHGPQHQTTHVAIAYSKYSKPRVYSVLRL